MPIKNTESKLVFLSVLSSQIISEKILSSLTSFFKSKFSTSRILELSSTYMNLSFSETAYRLLWAKDSFS